MSEKPKHHATIVLERNYEATPQQVFAEFANPVERAKWSAPSGDELIYDESAFKAGGRDVFRCGPTGAPKFQGETIYQLIEADRCVISTEAVTVDGQQLAVSLNTLELEEAEGETRLKLTIQIVSSAGKGLVAGFESSNRSALEGLAIHLASLTR